MAKYSADTKRKIFEMSRIQGMGSRKIAKTLGISKSGVNDFLGRSGSNDKDAVSEVYKPRVLIYDIETAPMMSYHWDRFKVFVGQAQVIREGYMLCWAAKWLGEDEVAFDSIRNNPGEHSEDDTNVVASLAEMIGQADIIVAHNNKRFDLPMVQGYMVRAGMPPLPPVKIVDTLMIAKKNFRFSSNSLDALGQHLGCGAKLNHTGFDLWRGCLADDPESWATMEDYNIQDVNLLETVYLKLRPWDRQHPNVSLYYPNGVQRCPCCGSTELTVSDKLAYTNVGAYTTFVCGDCGKPSRSRKNLKTPEQRANIVSNIAS